MSEQTKSGLLCIWRSASIEIVTTEVTADFIVRRYGANARREVRITETGYDQSYADLLITKCRQMRGSLKFFLLGDYCDLHQALHREMI